MVTPLKHLLRRVVWTPFQAVAVGLFLAMIFPKVGTYVSAAWGTLPLNVQPLVGIALILLVTVVPFALMIYVGSGEKDA